MSAAPKIQLALTRLLQLAAIVFLLMYAWVAAQRVGYPYELEWMEGGLVDHVARLLGGQPLYVEPSPDFVPYIYPPLYYHVCGLVARITGVGFLALRVVSVLASLGCFVGILRFVQRETTAWSAGLIAAGLFAATYVISGSFFDIGRVDSLLLCLLVWGGYIVRFKTSAAWCVVAGLVLGLAFLCKQSSLVAVLPIVLGALLMNRRRGLIVGGAFVLLTGATTWWLVQAHEGWYGYYVFQLPREHVILYRHLIEFWSNDVVVILIPFAAGLIYLLARLRSATSDENTDRSPALFLLLFCGGLLSMSWATRLHSGSFLNVFIPLHAAVCLAVGCALGSLQVRCRTGDRSRWVLMALLVALAVQFWWLRYDPRLQLPTAAQRLAGDQLIDRIRSIEGRVIVPFHGHLATLAGKQPFSHDMAVYDVQRTAGSPTADALRQGFEAALRRQDYEAIFLDFPGWHRETLEEFYEYQGPTIENIVDLAPMTGAQNGPWRLYRPRR